MLNSRMRQLKRKEGKINIWIRVCQNPTDKLPAALSTLRISGNQGNLLYQFGVARTLVNSDAEIKYIINRDFDNLSPETDSEWINSNCDHLVLPLSSSFRRGNSTSLNRWAAIIERLKMPVTVVGVGAQIPLNNLYKGVYTPGSVSGKIIKKRRVEVHADSVKRFVFAVLRRSHSIGVRGDVTRQYLESLGFPRERISIIGCPSLFTWGPEFHIEKKYRELQPNGQIGLSFDHRVGDYAAWFDRAVHMHKNSMIYMQQSRLAEMVVTGRNPDLPIKGDSRFPLSVDHNLFTQQRLEYNPTAWGWIEHYKNFDFVCGTRLHGNIAAVLAGVPAHFLAHDSRTLEIAQHHALPYTLVSDLQKDVYLNDLHERTNYALFNINYKILFKNYLEFLQNNGLQTLFPHIGDKILSFDHSLLNASASRTLTSNTQRRFAQMHMDLLATKIVKKLYKKK